MISIQTASDPKAVWFRASMLMLLCAGPLASRLKHGQLDDKVFEVMAQFPLRQMQPGVPQQGLPFDAQEFMKELEESA
jgi:hypothetical protein